MASDRSMSGTNSTPCPAIDAAGGFPLSSNGARAESRSPEDPDQEGLQQTPARIVRSWKEIYGDYGQRAEDELVTVIFDDEILPKMGTPRRYEPGCGLMPTNNIFAAFDALYAIIPP